MPKDAKILVTGSSGLVGSAICSTLAQEGIATKGLDIRGDDQHYGDVRDFKDVRSALADCIGVVHLAAIPRVVLCEEDPVSCWATNVEGLSVVIDEIERTNEKPWLLFVSSREVYGEPEQLPVREDAQFRPMNVYGRSKVEGERLVNAASGRGLRTSIVRLSNVYGSVSDHADRVIPAFAHAAATGGLIRVEGNSNSFDFTHVSDVAIGLFRVIELLLEKPKLALPSIHLVTGCETTLEELAELAIQFSGNSARLIEAPPRSYDVSHFVGDPSRAKRYLAWEARVKLQDGLMQLVHEYSVGVS